MKNVQTGKSAAYGKKAHMPSRTVKKALAAFLSVLLAAAPHGLILAENESFFESFENAVIGKSPDSIECMPGAGKIYVAACRFDTRCPCADIFKPVKKLRNAKKGEKARSV